MMGEASGGAEKSVTRMPPAEFCPWALAMRTSGMPDASECPRADQRRPRSTNWGSLQRNDPEKFSRLWMVCPASKIEVDVAETLVIRSVEAAVKRSMGSTLGLSNTETGAGAVPAPVSYTHLTLPTTPYV